MDIELNWEYISDGGSVWAFEKAIINDDYSFEITEPERGAAVLDFIKHGEDIIKSFDFTSTSQAKYYAEENCEKILKEEQNEALG